MVNDAYACGEDTRQRILLAAAECFSDNGYRGTTIRQICRKAKANVASVKYYFGSKRDLYIETFQFLFLKTSLELSQNDKPIRNEAEWRQELFEWAYGLLSQITANSPLQRWRSRLFARERTAPTEVIDIIFKRYMEPAKKRLEELLLMALPDETHEDQLRIWSISTISQCTVYAQREEPWDKLLYPQAMSYEDWLKSVAEHVVDSITSRLSFRRGTAL